MDTTANGSYYDDIDYSDPTLSFERGRIKQLQDEREAIQKKTFTKWCNSFLSHARVDISDLFTDLNDGILLIKLLEIISGEKLGKPNKGRMRVHKIENLNKVLQYLKKKGIQLENIGAEDILDCNPRLILGLIWTIILRFQIESIVESIDEEDQNSEKKQAKDALLLWCQRKTAGYPGVKVENFTSSWRSGLGFNALIHAHRPDLVDYSALDPYNHISNLNNAFDVAEKQLGITRLLDAEDVDVSRPDEKSIITYVSTYYHYFAKQREETTGARRVGKVIGQLMMVDRMKTEYENLSSDLLHWIRMKIEELSDRRFPNGLRGIQEEMLKFKQYRTAEKPPKYKEKGELEALFFSIQTKAKAMRSKLYVPSNGKQMKDIEAAWTELDSAEHARQVALHEELLRQERLEQLARKFERKGNLRDAWLHDMTIVLQDFNFGKTSAQVEASVKKHEAISADILPRADRFKLLTSMASELYNENYYDRDRIKIREKEISDKWNYLLQALERRRLTLMNLNDLMTMLRDIDTLCSEFQQLEPSVKSRDLGKHILGVEDLQQKHALVEAQIAAQGDWVANIMRKASGYIRNKGSECEMLQQKIDVLQQTYENLKQLSQARRNALERARELYQFIQNHEEEESWLKEKCHVCSNLLTRKDINAIQQLNRQYKNLDIEMQAHWQRSKQVISSGELLLTNIPPAAREDVNSRLKSLQEKWEDLRRLFAALNKWLKDVSQASQYLQDANEAESWIRAMIPLCSSDDFGHDQDSAESLLLRHSRLEEEIAAYRSDIQRLDETAAEISKADVMSTAYRGGLNNLQAQNGHEASKEQLVPQCRVIYKYSGHGLTVDKGEIVTLNQKTNDDWWKIVKYSGQEGYVPANYVKEIEPNVNGTSKSSPSTEGSPNDGLVENRQKQINTSYSRLIMLAQGRHRFLDDAVKSYRFHRECDEFEQWADEMDKAFLEELVPKDVDANRKKFNDLATDMVANGGTRLSNINSMAEDLIANRHSQSERIRARQKEVNDLWKHLLSKQDHKAAQLSTAERLAMFEQTCEETRTWMSEKFLLLDDPSKVGDGKNFQTLQRNHQNLERELRPVEEKMSNLRHLADEVRKAHPSEATAVSKKEQELQQMWEALKAKAEKRRKQLEENRGHQMFNDASLHLLSWIGDVNDKLRSVDRAVDVAGAEDLLKKHYDLSDDIRAHDDEFFYVADLGNRLMQKSPDMKDVEDMLKKLDDNRFEMIELWKAKEKALKDHLELQHFCREADHIDACTKSHEAFLELRDVGDSVESVEALQKQHSNYEGKLTAQNDRLSALRAMAEKLIDEGHPESQFIADRSKKICQNRDKLKQSSRNRKDHLDAALAFQQFQRDAHELLDWIAEKSKIANDDSYKDGSNLDRKLKKHEAFEAELKANTDRLLNLNEEGAELIKVQHFATLEIRKTLEKLNHEWQLLQDQCQERGLKMRQAIDQKDLNRTLEDAHMKLDELERTISDDLGSDLRSVRELSKKHQMLEHDINCYADRLRDIVTHGEAIANAGHFDSSGIMVALADFNTRFEKLKGPAATRRNELEESRKLHQFIFDVDCELQWIQEKEPAATSKTYGQSLTDTLNLLKKHEQLEQEFVGHQPAIDQMLVAGDKLIKASRYKAKSVKAKCDELQDAWNGLKTALKYRGNQLNLALQGQQYLNEANDFQAIMLEKRQLLAAAVYGSDEDSALKLLSKHKATEEEIANMAKTTIPALKKSAEKLSNLQHPHTSEFMQKQALIEQQFSELSSLAVARRQALEDAVKLCQYLQESQDLEQWINDQLQIAMGEEYGSDYEHVLILRNSFEDFKQQVKTGSERFILCEEAAKALLERNPPFIKEIQQRQEQLRTAWSLLLDYIESRDVKLDGAEEIHRFNKDVTESLGRIQEKSQAISSNDLGRDMNTVQSLLRRHEAFENELAALEAQLQILLDDSLRLQQQYPGGNAKHIASQQQLLVENYNNLQDRAVQRRGQLHAAYDLQRFLASARDIISWANDVMNELQTAHIVRDVVGVELLLSEHNRLGAEINARQEDFEQLAEMADQMIQAGHYASEEITEKVNQVDGERFKIRNDYDAKDVYLKQLLRLHVFYRDTKQIESLISRLEASLSSYECSTNVEEVSAQIKRHETFEKLIRSHKEKVDVVLSAAALLVEDKHFESPNIELTEAKIAKRWNKLLDATKQRQLRLEEAILYAKLINDVSEMEYWIEDRKKKLLLQPSSVSTSNIESKMKVLQKRQAFEAELATNEPRIRELLDRGESLPNSVVQNGDVKTRLRNLLLAWEDLLKANAAQLKELEEAREMLNFNQLIERILEWIRRKELLVHDVRALTVGKLPAEDVSKILGCDYEHCLLLQKRLEDEAINDEVITNACQCGTKLLKQAPPDATEIEQKLQDLNEKWKATNSILKEYKQLLASALSVHAFNRDTHDTIERINEKAVILSCDDHSGDVNTVEAMLREQDSIERDMVAIDEKLKQHELECQKLLKTKPLLESSLLESQSKILSSWDHLKELASHRKALKSKKLNLEKFLIDVNASRRWLQQLTTEMSGHIPATTVTKAKAQLEAHLDRRPAVESRKEIMKNLIETGKTLIQEQPENDAVIRQGTDELMGLAADIDKSFDTQTRNLKSNFALQEFLQCYSQVDIWLNNMILYLRNNDVGDSLPDALNLARKHEGFENKLSAQASKVEELYELEGRVSSEYPENQDRVSSLCKNIDAKYKLVLTDSKKRKQTLESSKKWQIFLKNCSEVMNWLNSKLQIAFDESYTDPTNLKNKLQKHSVFDAELTANRDRLEGIQKEGERLIAESHFASEQIREQLDQITKGFEELTSVSSLKLQRLNDAYEAYQFNRKLDDFERWIDICESQLQVDEHGHDLSSVSQLLRNHENLVKDIDSRRFFVAEAEKTITEFANRNHFQLPELQKRTQEIIERYHALEEPAHIRHDNLQQALTFFKWLQAVTQMSNWINERLRIIDSCQGLGDSINSTQKLVKKHEKLMAEIASHESVITSLEDQADAMINAGNFASQRITQSLNNLKAELKMLKDKSSDRQSALKQMLEAQQYYMEAEECEDWMAEKLPLVVNPELGKDEISVEALLKCLGSTELEISGFHEEVLRLGRIASELVSREHSDSTNIVLRKKRIESAYDDLLRATSRRRQQLLDASRYYGFVQKSDELLTILKEKETIANLEDYGKDLEHCQELIQKFEVFMRDLSSSGEKVAAAQKQQEELVRANHPYSASIKTRWTEVAQLWSDVNEAAVDRQNALVGARQVHQFDQDADDTLSWLQEKEAFLLSVADDFSRTDQAGIRVLFHHHDAFLRELSAVEKQVDVLSQSADRLTSTFPETREHIEVRRQEMKDQLADVLAASAQRGQKLHQAQLLQAYFDDYRELMAWINEVVSSMNNESLAKDVQGSEAQLHCHRECRSEIDARSPAVKEFIGNGRGMIKNNHLLSAEIEEKVNHLESSFKILNEIWTERMTLYTQNHDAELWKSNANNLDSWLYEQEPHLESEWKHAESAAAVESLTASFTDFLSTLDAQRDKFEALKKLTMVEQAFSSIQAKEQQRRREEEERLKKQRQEQIKTVEKHKILQERRQERERRRTQEIQFFKPAAADISLSISASTSPASKRHDYPLSVLKQDQSQPLIELSSNPLVASISLETGRSDKLVRPAVPPKPTILVQAPSLRPVLSDDVSYSLSRDTLGINSDNERQGRSLNYGSSDVQTQSTPVPDELRKVSSFRSDALLPRKTPKRTPSFTTRRAQSLKKVRQWEDMENIEKDGVLERKQELQSGGKKAAIRSWKSYYTILCGQLLCFFKDEEQFMESMAAAPPVNILNASCVIADDYSKRKYVFKLTTSDGAEYLFSPSSEKEMNDWVAKISFHATLPPAQQLKPYQELPSPNHDLESASNNRIWSGDAKSSLRIHSQNDSGFMSPLTPKDETPPPSPPKVPPPHKAFVSEDDAVHLRHLGVSDSSVTVAESRNGKAATLPSFAAKISDQRNRSSTLRSDSLSNSQDADAWREHQSNMTNESCISLDSTDSMDDPKKKKRSSKLGSLFRSRKRDSKDLG